MMDLIILSGNPVVAAGGDTIAMVGYIIVFIALIILVCIFILLPKMIQAAVNKRFKQESAKNGNVQEIKMDADINVAIAMGLHMYMNELHDKESNIITIRNAQKQYSPWSSKIYGVMNQPERKR